MAESSEKILGRIEEKIDSVLTLARKHDEQIHGTIDKPGLKQEVAEIKGFVDFRRKIEVIILTAAIGLATTGFVSAAIYLIRTMPTKG